MEPCQQRGHVRFVDRGLRLGREMRIAHSFARYACKLAPVNANVTASSGRKMPAALLVHAAAA